MKFAIVVNEGPYQHQASNTAYHFTRSALEKGHQVVRVFFYHDGVNNGTCLTAPPQDEPQIVNMWSRLGRDHDLDLVVCVAAAQRRGVMDERGKTVTSYRPPIWLPVSGSRDWAS